MAFLFPLKLSLNSVNPLSGAIVFLWFSYLSLRTCYSWCSNPLFLYRKEFKNEIAAGYEQTTLAMTNEKGVYKGEFFPPCTEEEALSSSVGFCFLCFLLLRVIGGKLFLPLILREVSPSVSFCLLCLFSFSGGYKGGEAPIIVWIPDRNIQE